MQLASMVNIKVVSLYIGVLTMVFHEHNNSNGGGILFNGAFSTGPMPIVMTNQVIYRSIENRTVPSTWPGEYFKRQSLAAIFNIVTAHSNTTKDDPVMSPKNWRMTSSWPFNQSWIPSSYPNLAAPGLLEGSVVILSSFHPNLAVVTESNLTSNTLSFCSIISFSDGMSKSTTRYDPITRTYLTLCNPVTVLTHSNQRNVLSLTCTKDLLILNNWNIAIDHLLYDDTGLPFSDSLRYTEFQYVGWQFDTLSTSVHKASCIDWQCGGLDIIYLINTAYCGANSFDNSNRITYKSLLNYRSSDRITLR
ncbi:unnamed protein product [Adineta ricciae]|uniref:Uncharacterized protein n=1 Tax=Adineta ricciae TaxID=249248 RepID=A0A814CMA4_ADIRI|nr:unnamed protein product [Adineta ricciae]CAF1192160.1 unnamed protein product [Adineta ricciae]